MAIQTNILYRLRQPEFLLFRALMELLHEVHSHSNINKMDSKNLVLVWSPNFIITPKDDYDHLKRSNILKGLSFMLKYCIENYDEVFS